MVKMFSYSTLLIFLSATSYSNYYNAYAFSSGAITISSAAKASAAANSNFDSNRNCNHQLNAFDGAFAAVDGFYHSQPYFAAFLTCSIKASAADFLAQSNEEPKSATDSAVAAMTSTEDNVNNEPSKFENILSFVDDLPVDLRRNLAFITYGGLYQGMTQYFLYAKLFPMLFGSDPTLQTVLSQVLVDNFMLGPFFCLPTVYSIKAVLAGQRPIDGINKYKDHIFSQYVLFRYWSIWVPVQLVNFSFVPEHLRVPFCAVISFFWVCLLSTVSARNTQNNNNGQMGSAMEQIQQQLQDGTTAATATTSPKTTTTSVFSSRIMGGAFNKNSKQDLPTAAEAEA